ncbi:dihydrofolate reductase [Photorhabdus laumondii subsp. laumondii]|uniref:dihydrofolate reductase family protein n=1 Tax=Photorhabdus TaxID=29487 RepID=UPI000733923B|nr:MULTISPECIES: dihydrofolate reductase family protein [Photorhabdus]PQQ22820.1 dihydrofolate reductase [Photorhabdus luminescens]KTL61701.1 dihydrofolate reductase [Photorhabdus laumondii subsp. laumondii]MBS9427698.1 dihydrofolate reductase [Photorhabdus akhurstii]MCC8457916.1 dihydrofolate reductase [Photorhabdus aegyptia]PQQ23863.1 dihydrofolate reductase [Photorhabdus luminescens]
MPKLIYYVAATIDGYIANNNHGLDWLDEFALGDDATPYDDFYQSIGAVIMGAETYEWIMANSSDDWPYKNIPAFVLSHRALPMPEGVNITITNETAGNIAAVAKKVANGKNVWLVGGGKAAEYFAEAGELQQIFLTMIPVFLGTGIEILPVSEKVRVTPKNQRLLRSGAIEILLDVNTD